MDTPNAANSDRISTLAELEEELRQAERDFACGDFIELTLEQLEHCAATGESPWPEESHS